MTDLTPELYVRLNESADDAAESLYDQWSAAAARARGRFLALRDRLPPMFVQLCETRCLHDAEVLGVTTSRASKSPPAQTAVIELRQDADFLTLSYDLAKPLARSVPVRSGVFAPGPPVTWLYDEVHPAGDAASRHEILLSTGEVLSLEFVAFSMTVERAPRLPRPSATLVGVGR